MKVIHLQKGVEHLRSFIKKAQKHMPDRNNRGYTDGILYLNDVLDGLQDLMKYVDEPQLNYYKWKKGEGNDRQNRRMD
jgi:hypothetical protein|tara:strand:+ start:270 stop:503 length:234 start_codon:yes stop_codon:yes gene_type:complete